MISWSGLGTERRREGFREFALMLGTEVVDKKLEETAAACQDTPQRNIRCRPLWAASKWPCWAVRDAAQVRERARRRQAARCEAQPSSNRPASHPMDQAGFGRSCKEHRGLRSPAPEGQRPRSLAVPTGERQPSSMSPWHRNHRGKLRRNRAPERSTAQAA